jgi:hypothetical protein
VLKRSFTRSRSKWHFAGVGKLAKLLPKGSVKRLYPVSACCVRFRAVCYLLVVFLLHKMVTFLKLRLTTIHLEPKRLVAVTEHSNLGLDMSMIC